MPLLHLPVELLDHIALYLHPSSHLDFALTCHLLASVETIKHQLAHHRHCFDRYRHVTDLESTTVPDLLRAAIDHLPDVPQAHADAIQTSGSHAAPISAGQVINDPIAVWHVRSMAVYGTRGSRSDWQRQIWQVKTPARSPPGPASRWEDDRHVLTEQEIAGVELLVQNCFRDESVGIWSTSQFLMRDIRRGRDESMKALIVAICPRISAISIGKTLCASYRDINNAASTRHPIRKISQLLFNIHLAGLPMPLGFQSLRKIAVSVPNPTGNLSNRVSKQSVKPLLTLPNLEYLYLHDIGPAQQPRDIDIELRPRSSNVQSIYFDRTRLSAAHIWDLLQTVKVLRSLAFEECDFPDDDIPGHQLDKCPATPALVNRVTESHSEHLQSLTFPTERITYRKIVRFPLDLLGKVSSLQHTTVNIEDFRQSETSTQSSHMSAAHQATFAWPEDLRLPALMSLELLGSVVLDQASTASLDSALTHAIKSGLMPQLRCIDPRKVQIPMSRINLGGGPTAGEFSSRQEAFPSLCGLSQERGFAVLTSWDEHASEFVADFPQKDTCEYG